MKNNFKDLDKFSQTTIETKSNQNCIIFITELTNGISLANQISLNPTGLSLAFDWLKQAC